MYPKCSLRDATIVALVSWLLGSSCAQAEDWDYITLNQPLPPMQLQICDGIETASKLRSRHDELAANWSNPRLAVGKPYTCANSVFIVTPQREEVSLRGGHAINAIRDLASTETCDYYYWGWHKVPCQWVVQETRYYWVKFASYGRELVGLAELFPTPDIFAEYRGIRKPAGQ